jgi:hypothetical protein
MGVFGGAETPAATGPKAGTESHEMIDLKQPFSTCGKLSPDDLSQRTSNASAVAIRKVWRGHTTCTSANQ